MFSSNPSPIVTKIAAQGDVGFRRWLVRVQDAATNASPMAHATDSYAWHNALLPYFWPGSAMAGNGKLTPVPPVNGSSST